MHRMGELPDYLEAISAGSVFFGAYSYIGNAPNFMVRSIAEEAGTPHAELLRLHRALLRGVPASGVHRRDPDLLLNADDAG